MIKKIKSWGASKAILFNKEDCEIWDLKEGDIVEIEINKDINWKVMHDRVANDKLKGGIEK